MDGGCGGRLMGGGSSSVPFGFKFSSSKRSSKGKSLKRKKTSKKSKTMKRKKSKRAGSRRSMMRRGLSKKSTMSKHSTMPKKKAKKTKKKGKKALNPYMKALKKARDNNEPSFTYNGKTYYQKKTKTGMIIYGAKK